MTEEVNLAGVAGEKSRRLGGLRLGDRFVLSQDLRFQHTDLDLNGGRMGRVGVTGKEILNGVGRTGFKRRGKVSLGRKNIPAPEVEEFVLNQQEIIGP